jgi:hypothetical protein
LLKGTASAVPKKAASSGASALPKAGAPGELARWGGNAGVQAQPERLICLLPRRPHIPAILQNLVK